MTIKFFKRGNMIIARVSDRKQMIRVTTGIKAPTHLRFYETKECFGGLTPDVQDYNASLARERFVLEELVEKYKDLSKVREAYRLSAVTVEPVDGEDSMYLRDILYRYITQIESGDKKTRKKKKFAPGSISTYTTMAHIYHRFTGAYIDLRIDQFDLAGKALAEKQERAKQFEKHFDKFIDWMIDQEIRINTRRNAVLFISIVLRELERERFLQLPRIQLPEMEEIPIVTLPIDFMRDFLMDKHKLYDKFDPTRKYLYELCCMMLITSLRISDARSLSKSDFVFIGGEMFMIRENQKTGEDSTVPIPPPFSDRIVYNLNNYGKVYTPSKVSGIKSNIDLPYLFRMYPEMHQMITVRKKNPQGERIAVTAPLCEIVHPHMMRKTAITSMIANGVSVDHVRFASGHKSDAIKRYIGYVEKTHKSELRNYYDKLLGSTG